VPVALLISLWGGQPEKTGAYVYLLLYRVLSSFPMIVFLLTGGPEEVLYLSRPGDLWALCLALIFLVKLPLYGLHM